MLTIAAELLERIRRHGEATWPQECAGLLLGPSQGQIVEIVPLENTLSESRHNRVALDPLAIARAEREAASRGLGVWGFYHSHPDHPPISSQYDLEHAAFTSWSYVIVSVLQGRADEVRSWSLVEDRSQFVVEEIKPCPPS